ncbi:MAG: type III-A CRISPR-associated RAMP protein Csm3 [Phycisphaerae bacterium]|nr:type III-A CRISPR-associated RAMP protein Csm3 [Phycisphaerae bacterium]MCK6500630.1 type III-A CRISPR-associated RAMP protein Csm3 [Nitrospira sp.]
MKKLNHYVIRGEIELLSGTRIGGSDDVLQIGGTDLTCIKDPTTGKPYIPGSSLKGKMRSSLEKHLGKVNGREPCGCAKVDCPVCRVFGPHKNTNHTLGPTRIIVRDAPLISGEFAIENKTESVNRRDTGAAEHPRTVERVAAGAKFALEIGVQEFDMDRDFAYTNHKEEKVTGHDALLEVVCHCLDLVEDTGVGAGTGKGYGKVKIEIQPETKTTRRNRRGAGAPAATAR